MFDLGRIAEEKIREAMDRGEFDNLPGAGRPLCLDDDSTVPPDLRVAYRILRNAGCIPPELEVRKEILTLKGLLKAATDEGERVRTIRELNDRLLRLGLLSRRAFHLDDFPEYRDRIGEKLVR